MNGIITTGYTGITPEDVGLLNLIRASFAIWRDTPRATVGRAYWRNRLHSAVRDLRAYRVSILSPLEVEAYTAEHDAQRDEQSDKRARLQIESQLPETSAMRLSDIEAEREAMVDPRSEHERAQAPRQEDIDEAYRVQAKRESLIKRGLPGMARKIVSDAGPRTTTPWNLEADKARNREFALSSPKHF